MEYKKQYLLWFIILFFCGSWSISFGQNRKELLKIVNQKYSKYIEYFANQDAAGLAGLYTLDGSRMYNGGQVVAGRKAIEEDIQKYISRTGPVTVIIKVKDLWFLDNEIYETGEWIYSHRDNEMNTALSRGNYLTIWKQENETWKIFRDISLP